jgi:hypothetical protein
MTSCKDDLFYNKYTTKKSIAHGLVVGALLAANAAQLRVLLCDQMLNSRDPKWIVPFVLVCLSGLAQLLLLIFLAVLANFNLANHEKKNAINVLNNIVLALCGIVFCVNIVSNVFIQIDFAALLNKATSSSFWSTTDPFAAAAAASQFN